MSHKQDKRRPRCASQADRDLFRDAVGPVRQIKSPERSPGRNPPPPRAHMRQRDEAAVLDELLADFDPSTMETGAELGWTRTNAPRTLLKKLRRGQYSIQDELDLHQMTARTAREVLQEFLAECVAEEHSCVRIIHGKGLRSGPKGPVLKALTDHLLRRHKAVVAFASAPPAEGGTGAVIVLLQTRP